MNMWIHFIELECINDTVYMKNILIVKYFYLYQTDASKSS